MNFAGRLGLQDDGLAAGAEGAIRQHEPRAVPADPVDAADPALRPPHRQVDVELLAGGLAGRQDEAVAQQLAAVLGAVAGHHGHRHGDVVHLAVAVVDREVAAPLAVVAVAGVAQHVEARAEPVPARRRLAGLRVLVACAGSAGPASACRPCATAPGTCPAPRRPGRTSAPPRSGPRSRAPARRAPGRRGPSPRAARPAARRCAPTPRRPSAPGLQPRAHRLGPARRCPARSPDRGRPAATSPCGAATARRSCWRSRPTAGRADRPRRRPTSRPRTGAPARRVAASSSGSR